MNKTLWVIRGFFFILCLLGAWLLWYSTPDWGPYLNRAIVMGGLLGILVILVDIMLEGFSLRGLTALTFGLALGGLIAFFISSSPLFEYGDPEIIFIVRMTLYIIMMYFGAVVALRGKDEFNLIIPYVRFMPQKVESPLVIVDVSALIDGRVLGICQCRFLGPVIVIPSFVIDKLKSMSDSKNSDEQAKGRKGLEILNELRDISGLEVRIHDSEVKKEEHLDTKLIFLAKSLQAKLLTIDYNLAKLAEFHGVQWLNIHALSKSLSPEVSIGEVITVRIVKEGKEPNQAVGFMTDGSMVVVNDALNKMGRRVEAQVVSVIPSVGGKMIFARLQS